MDWSSHNIPAMRLEARFGDRLVPAFCERPGNIWAMIADAAARNPDGEAIEVRPGDRIAQLLFTRIARPQFAIVSAFSASAGRQEGGFGSTGVEAACPDRPPARNS